MQALRDRARPRPAGGTRSGTLWNVAQYGGGRFVTFVSTLVLARLLAPKDFGLVALALLAINFFDRFKDLGVGPALVQDKRRWDDIAPTGATMTAATAVVISAVCALGAPWFAAMLTTGPDVDALVPIIRVLALFLLLSGLTVFPDAALRRRMRFRERAVPELAGALVKAVVSIGTALAGAGAWALVWGQLAATAVSLVLYWRSYAAEPRPERGHGWDGHIASAFVRYGGALTGIAVLALVLDNVDYFVIGRRLGSEELGYYTMAFRLPEMLVVGVCIVIGQVLFSSFSRMQDDPAALRRQYLDATSLVATVTVPLGIGLAATASPIVHLILGPQYVPAIPLLQCLGVYSAVYSLSFHAGEVFKATGRTRLMLWLAVTQLAVFAPLLWWAAGISTLAVASAFLAGHVLYAVIRLAITRQVLGLTLADQLDAIRPPVLAAAVMAVVAWGTCALTSGMPVVVQLAAGVLLGVAAYVAVLHLLRPDLLGRVLRFRHHAAA